MATIPSALHGDDDPVHVIRSTINNAGYYIVLHKGDYNRSCELARNFSSSGIAVSILPRQHLGALTNHNDSKKSLYDNESGCERFIADIEDFKQTAAINDAINSNMSLTISVNVARNIVSALVSFLRWMLKSKDNPASAARSSTPEDTKTKQPSIPRHPAGIQRSISTIPI